MNNHIESFGIGKIQFRYAPTERRLLFLLKKGISFKIDTKVRSINND